MDDLDEDRSYLGIEPLGVVGDDAEARDEPADDEGHEAEDTVGRGEVLAVVVVLVDDDDGQAAGQEDQAQQVQDPVERDAVGAGQLFRGERLAGYREDALDYQEAGLEQQGVFWMVILLLSFFFKLFCWYWFLKLDFIEELSGDYLKLMN